MDLIAILTQYIAPVIVVICLAVGWCIKNLVSNDRLDDFIPTIAAVLGVAMAIWANLGNPVTPDVIALGLVSGLASTGLYEAMTHWVERGGDVS